MKFRHLFHFCVIGTRWLSRIKKFFTRWKYQEEARVINLSNLATKEIVSWTKENLRSAEGKKQNRPKLSGTGNRSMAKISGYVVRPKNIEKKLPVLIYVHGGPFSTSPFSIRGPSPDRQSRCDWLLNIRGSSGFGDEYMDADSKENAGTQWKTFGLCSTGLKKQPVGPVIAYTCGWKLRDFVVLSATAEPTRVKAVIAEYPLCLNQGYLSQSWIDEFARNEYGDPQDENLMKRLMTNSAQ